jgi:hypothetical protein
MTDFSKLIGHEKNVSDFEYHKALDDYGKEITSEYIEAAKIEKDFNDLERSIQYHSEQIKIN